MISYVVPYYNGSRYIEETLMSILTQDNAELEVIVIDDCSVPLEYERLVGIISEINDTRLKLLSNATNIGLMKTLNRGITTAIYGFVSILGQDDMVPSTHARIMTKYLRDNKSMAICFCDAYLVFDRTTTNIELRGHRLPKGIYASTGKVFRKLWRRNFIVSTGLCFRKSFFLEQGCFDSTFKNYGEWLTWLKISSKYQVGYQANLHTYYRKHDSNITNYMFGNKYLETYRYNIYVVNRGYQLSEKKLIDHVIFLTLSIRELFILFYKKIVPVRRSEIINKIKAKRLNR